MVYQPDYDEDAEDEPDMCSPSACGDCWMGDGLCEHEIERQAQESEDYHAKYVKENAACLACKASLIQYEIPTDRLWVWPGVWPEGAYYNPIIALDVFAVYGAPKGEVHEPVKDETASYHHIWVGTGKYRSEKLIKLTGSINREDHMSSDETPTAPLPPVEAQYRIRARSVLGSPVWVTNISEPIETDGSSSPIISKSSDQKEARLFTEEEAAAFLPQVHATNPEAEIEPVDHA